jgi:hypothetical protein
MTAFKVMVFSALVLVSMSGSAARADKAEDKAVQFVQKLGGKVTGLLIVASAGRRDSD